MKIVEPNNGPIFKTFNEVHYGEVFNYKGEYFLKTEEIQERGGDWINIVHLRTGELGAFYGSEHVLPVSCELVIK